MPAGVGKRLSAEEKVDVVRRYGAGQSSLAIAVVFGVTDVAIRATLRRMGIARRGASACHRKYTINESVFDALTPETEYWLGMLITDGSVTDGDGTPRLELQLKLSDEPHVKAFRSFMGSDAPISHKMNKIRGNWSCCWSVRSKKLASVLSRWGITSRKTFVTDAHESLRNSRHFWRGVVDGDGEIVDRNGYPGINIVGTHTLCKQFLEFCSGIVKHPERMFLCGNRNYCATVRGNDALLVKEALYRDAPVALERKHSKALATIAKYQGRIFRLLPLRRRS